MIQVRYRVAGKILTTVTEADYPRSGDWVRIDGAVYIVNQAVRTISMCPPWLCDVELEALLPAA